jgi:hypothetical protein
LQEIAGAGADPWPQVEAAFRDPKSILPQPLRADVVALTPTWKGLPSKRRQFLKLLSRFELTVDQATKSYEEGARNKCGWGATDAEILANPYRIYERSRHDPDGVNLLTVDRGVFPDDSVRLKHPLDEPSRLESAIDIRRVRAFGIAALEQAANSGHSLLSRSKAVEAIRSFPVRPECNVTGDVISASLVGMAPEVVPAQVDNDNGLQLARYRAIGELARKNVLGRVGGARHLVKVDWEKALRQRLGKPLDEADTRAHQEKIAALNELAESRFSILAGPAGAGKTTVLGILCAQAAIATDTILMLAPTGKARVRMQELAGEGTRAYTIAQFLNQHGRYDGRAGRYVMSNRPKATGYGTVIIDESSMLTEDMLGALLDALQGVKRLILVGDPAQLPPIGAGRPFVDIVAKLRPQDVEARFPRIAPGYAELTIERRQIGTERPDLRLARWFGAAPPSAGDDEIFIAADAEHKTIRFVEWKAPVDIQHNLIEVLREELKLETTEDFRGFNRCLGAVTKGEFDYFNATRGESEGSVNVIEQWQILSPLRGMPFGVGDVNRLIHERYRAGFIGLATRFPRSIPKPFGAERIVYGDKVINLSNHRRETADACIPRRAP